MSMTLPIIYNHRPFIITSHDTPRIPIFVNCVGYAVAKQINRSQQFIQTLSKIDDYELAVQKIRNSSTLDVVGEDLESVYVILNGEKLGIYLD